ncbi:hypothetical protein Glove_236g2 [Diversispora epigaea]|uniref:Protein kinase domain-containing protein n=1 Tax=Diversispora epigaea TaxID=1348612 RepID=A0A397IF53_9GLOM|nr:hypothetical protein Glove_236g2 [Diversispora epigaea]
MQVELNFTLDNTSQYLVKCYGIIKNPTNNEYMLVLGHYEKNLRQFLNDTQSLSLLQKYNIILDIAYSLSKIHEEKVIHRDLHSANILYYSDSDRWFISDLGFSSPINDSNNIFKIYGDLPHIAPEVYGNILTTKSDGSTIKHTEKSDIYSLGIIMWEVFTGKIPFDGRKHDIDLALDIFTNKSRPTSITWMKIRNMPIICKLKEGGGGIGGNHTFSKFNMKKIKNYIKGLMKNNNDSKENKKLESKSDSNRINIQQIIEICDSRQCSECIISDRIELDFNKNNENEATAIEDDNENDIEKTDDNFGSQDNNHNLRAENSKKHFLNELLEENIEDQNDFKRRKFFEYFNECL